MDSNTVAQILLVIAAVYLVYQITQNAVTTESMATTTEGTGTSTVVNVTPSGVNAQSGTNASVQVMNSTPNQTTLSVNQPANGETIVNVQPQAQPMPSDASNAQYASAVYAPPNPEATSASPIATSTPATMSGVSPLTAISEELYAAAPNAESSNTPFNPSATDFDAMFGDRDQINPADLIPKAPLPELYAGIKTDPSLDTNFTYGQYSVGITTKVGASDFSNDLRGSIAIPLKIVSPWTQSTKQPDIYRKSLADIS